jgi:hypothetical protein
MWPDEFCMGSSLLEQQTGQPDNNDQKKQGKD